METNRIEEIGEFIKQHYEQLEEGQLLAIGKGAGLALNPATGQYEMEMFIIDKQGIQIQDPRCEDRTEAKFRIGACHGVQGAVDLLRDDLAEKLSDYIQVLLDWRAGATEQRGFSGNPWCWTRESFDAYVTRFREAW